MSSSPMEVDVWKGDWGLPSVDMQCLQIMAYSKFCGAPVKANITNNPFWSPTGSLPVFRHGKTSITSFQDTVSYLQRKNFSADHNLTAKQKAECAAFTQMLQEKLLPGIKYTWWVDQKNFVDLSRSWYARALPFPLNFYYPSQYQSQAKTFIETMFVDEEDLAVIETQLFGEAEKCLTSLSIRLGENNFLFGNSPTSLDAILYGYLAPLLRTPFPNATLQNHLKACPNLVNYVARISQRYFPQVAQDYETKRVEEKSEAVVKASKRWRQFMYFFCTVTAMSSYAVYTGMLQTGKNEIEMEDGIDDEDPYLEFEEDHGD